ncbi:MAG TPA: alpha/beta fold hydrolase [Solirubrobacteraceae bacterium]
MLAHREDGSGPPVLLVHGYPESSYMWRHAMTALAAAGRRAIAPDLLGFGDTPADPPGTWERHVAALEDFRQGLGLDRLTLVVHDWGGLIGLRWACEHPDAVDALVISDTGFFPDGKWHGLAEAMRTEGQGEELVAAMTRDGFAAVLRQSGPGFDDAAIDEYWKAFGDEDRRRSQLDLYRSGDFEVLHAYDGCLAALDVPTLVLWGEADAFAPVAGAHRFHREIGGSELLVIEGAGHFLWDDEPQRAAQAVVDFLARSG